MSLHKKQWRRRSFPPSLHTHQRREGGGVIKQYSNSVCVIRHQRGARVTTLKIVVSENNFRITSRASPTPRLQLSSSWPAFVSRPIDIIVDQLPPIATFSRLVSRFDESRGRGEGGGGRGKTGVNHLSILSSIMYDYMVEIVCNKYLYVDRIIVVFWINDFSSYRDLLRLRFIRVF